MTWYAVAVGRVPGIYTSWDVAKKQIFKHQGARYKKFNTREEAEEYVEKFNTRDITVEYPLPDRYVAFTDGSYKKLGKKESAGVGIVIVSSDGQITKYYGHMFNEDFDHLSNIMAELYAIYVCLLLVDQSVNIFTDSEYSVNVITGVSTPKENIREINDIKLLISNHQAKGHVINIYHVYGHQGQEMNELADLLANLGREELIPLQTDK